jgi:Flp pilus assembly protein TadG
MEIMCPWCNEFTETSVGERLMAKQTWLRSILKSSEGASFVELALVLPIFMLIFVPAIDIGRAIYASIEVSSAAQAGAAYGVQNPTDVSGMQSASTAGASNISGVSAKATYGCECSDGTSASASCTTTPTCTYNYVNYVDVVATAPYATTFSYPWMPTSMNISREIRLRVGGD